MSKYQALIDALEAGPVEYACHVDGCVDRTCAFDEGHEVHECGGAQRLSAKGLCKLDCAEWKPINIAKPTIEVKAEDLRALLADLERAEKALREVVAVFDSNPSSIVDTVWVTGNRPETLYDHCQDALAQMAGG